ncbi:unnamed protein product, partial [marine sediment metagenome]
PIDLGKFKVFVSKDFYQASCGIEGFLRQGYFQYQGEFRVK